MQDSAYFQDDQPSAQTLHRKQPSTVSPLDTFAQPAPVFDDVDMSSMDGGSAAHSPASFLDPASSFMHRSHSADPPRTQNAQTGYDMYSMDSGINSSVPSLSPVNLGPGGNASGTLETSASPYPPTPHSAIQPSSFSFPSNGTLEEQYLSEQAVHYNTRASSRHKSQRSLSAGQLPRASFAPSSSNMQRHNSVAIAPLPMQDCEPAQIPVKGDCIVNSL